MYCVYTEFGVLVSARDNGEQAFADLRHFPNASYVVFQGEVIARR